MTPETLRKLTLLSGLALMLAGCLEGLAVGNMSNTKMAKSAHHQATHNSELLLAVAFAFPYCDLPPMLLDVAFWALQFGTWGNPCAYLVMAATNCPNPMFLKDSGLVPPGDGAGNFYTSLSMFLLMVPTSMGMFVSLILLMVGVARYKLKEKSI